MQTRKSKTAQRFGENIGDVVVAGNTSDVDDVVLNFVADEIKLYINMLDSRVKRQILCKGNGGVVVAVDGGSIGKFVTKLGE